MAFVGEGLFSVESDPESSLSVLAFSWSPPRLGPELRSAGRSSGPSKQLKEDWAGRKEAITISSLSEPRTFKAKELWEKNGAVIMAVRRPGCFLCRAVSAFEDLLEVKHSGSGVWSISSRTKGLGVLLSSLTFLDASVICSMHLF